MLQSSGNWRFIKSLEAIDRSLDVFIEHWKTWLVAKNCKRLNFGARPAIQNRNFPIFRRMPLVKDESNKLL